jgi:biopolymer transport protein ExbD
MALGRAARQGRRTRQEDEVKLNITSMMDMFTIILVFLLKNFSTEGALVAAAENLTLPRSTVERRAKESLSLKISKNSIVVETRMVVDSKEFEQLARQKEFLIPPLRDVLSKYADEARQLSVATGQPFSGSITIQGDTAIPYNVLTRVMYTCGQAGYPNMNMLVYRPE